ncbi:MAG: nitric oxide reductase transcriptional regulator NorR [Myxococcales bacterium]|nr:nitric oxide reductase transcriptional regulator NorR [Myxococcales bacterium]
MTTRRRDNSDFAPLAEIAVDLAANLTAIDRYERLVDALQRFLPCDAVTLLRLDGHALTPVAARGLAPEAMARRYALAEHPRLAQILRAPGPIRFEDSHLPDPFDGLLLADPEGLSRVHACMGSPLTVAGELIGVLTVDALAPSAFDDLTDEQVATAAALTAACMRTSQLIDALEQVASRSTRVAADLLAEARARSRDDLVGASPAMRALRDDVAMSARTDLAVLISGETGVGKEVVARAIHAAGGRRDRPLIYVNCAALPESIAESELFGHVRGAFTGAIETRAGKFEVADGGTLFLDEIGELPLALQAKLLRAVQSGEIQRVGADHPIHVDVRLMAATNRDLPTEVAAGRFRSDLFHRLSVLPIAVPPLRDRADDVAILAGFFLDESRRRLGLGPIQLTGAARQAMSGYDWPGNVRELEHTLVRAALRAAGRGRGQPVTIDAEHLDLPRRTSSPAPLDAVGPLPLPLADAVDEFKRRQIKRAVEASGGNWAAAARMLGLDRGNLHRTAERLGLHA